MTLNKTFRFAAIVATFLFIASFWGANVAKAECLAGYTERTIPMVINGCQYEVTLCVKCSIGPTPSDVVVQPNEIRMISPVGCQTWNPNQVLNYVYSQVMTYDFIYSYLCPNPYITMSPCTDPEQNYKVTTNHWLCWRAYLTEYFGAFYTVIRPCNYYEKCVEEYYWCLNEQGQVERHTTRTYSVPSPITAATCYGQSAIDIEWPTAIGDTTDCWFADTPCN
ncbi:MAG: hypothetical protein ACM3U1_09550 [Chloroflexota bacterium]